MPEEVEEKVVDSKQRNAWLAKVGTGCTFERFELAFAGLPSTFAGIHTGDWGLLADDDGHAICVGRVYRVRSTLEYTYVYFDKALQADESKDLSAASFALPPTGSIGRLQWTAFERAVPTLFGADLKDIPLIDDQTYVRELLQLAVMDDLLGPANGPNETIVDMGVRDRYLVGKLAPRQLGVGGEPLPRSGEGIEGLQGALAAEDAEEEPEGLEIHTGRHDTGAEFDSTTGKIAPEDDAADEIDVTNNQSLVPSSFGYTFCVDGDVEEIEIEARWGRYERVYDHEHFKEKTNKETGEKEQVKARVWQRVPCGGKIVLRMVEGAVSSLVADESNPDVMVQGTVRAKGPNSDRLITLFLINTQTEPETNKDAAWVFQPELIARSKDGADDPAIFRRRPLVLGDEIDKERSALEMIYRKQVEFGVGHGISVHATLLHEDPEKGIEVRTAVMPQYELPITETPGLDKNDRPAMQEMVAKGYMDMDALAEMERSELVAALKMLTDDYAAWIEEQRARIEVDVLGHDDPANQALGRCKEIFDRLEEGIAVLSNEGDETALAAFRFANKAMARQRIHSIYALARRRGEQPSLEEIDIRINRSWRPFQLAFVLLSIPPLANPLHKDRTEPLAADADLLWFPTGGGKTEAYLGVAAFTMVIRRLQGDLGGYDGSRGLSVIMRYTLRLLTLQQFQRAATLLCAMEVLRHEAHAKDDQSLGVEPFTLGLWVGNKVTPGTTKDSHEAISAKRDDTKYDAGASSPAQLTSCPWCGEKILAGRDVDVYKSALRTTIYCGDKKSRCTFSKGKSSRRKQPGLPVVVVDEELYHRPPSMVIATVDKFALMAWRGEARTLFGRATEECPRHGLLWPGADCTGNHRKSGPLPPTKVQSTRPIRPLDLIIQDEFHLISGPLGTMVGLYETAVDELSTWYQGETAIKPKIIASTATVRKAQDQVNNVFMRRVAIFPPHGLDVEDNFFSVQRPISEKTGRRYLGVCSPGSSRPAALIRVYTAFLTAAQALFDRFGEAADPFMTNVGYFNSLRELGGMKRLAEDDVQTRSYRVEMSMVDRPGLAQRSVGNISELTSRISSRDIPKYLDDLEVKFKCEYDEAEGKHVTNWEQGDNRAVDVVLATNMLSVGVDINRLGLMIVNGQPKSTAEYIQATSRVGRAFPGLVCAVLTWARPRDLSHYESFEHYHATFYKHVEAQSVTPFSPRAMDRGLTGALVSIMRLENEVFNPNPGAGELKNTAAQDVSDAIDVLAYRAGVVVDTNTQNLAVAELKERVDEWAKEASKGGRTLAYEKKGAGRATMVALLRRPGIKPWDNFTVPMSMREVEPGVPLIMHIGRVQDGPSWKVPIKPDEDGSEGGGAEGSGEVEFERPRQARTPTLSNVGALKGRSLAGQTVEVETESGGEKLKFRFLRLNDEVPRQSAFAVVIHKDVSQADVGTNGIAYGRLSLSELQDATSEEAQMNVRVSRPGASTSIKLPKANWREGLTVGLLVED